MLVTVGVSGSGAAQCQDFGAGSWAGTECGECVLKGWFQGGRGSSVARGSVGRLGEFRGPPAREDYFPETSRGVTFDPFAPPPPTLTYYLGAMRL